MLCVLWHALHQAKFEGFTQPDRAAVSYRETTESEPVIGYSNPMQNTSVLTAAQFLKRYFFLSLLGVALLLVFFMLAHF